MTEAVEARHWLVRGHVQGVGFRMYVQREAGRLDLKGHVRNTVDGAVEVVARGESALLDRLEVMLKQGPSASVVNSVESSQYEGDTSTLSPRFSIIS